MEQTGKPNIPAIMEDIRRRVASDIDKHKDRRMPFKQYVADFDGNAVRKAGELVHSEELRYLNQQHAFSLNTLSLDSISSHRPGIIGKLIVKAKRKFLSLIWEKLLKDYLFAQKDYNAQLVRFLNDLSKYVDARDASNFWELIRKVDVDVTKVRERIERISDEMSASAHSLEQRLRSSSDSTFSSLNERITRIQAQVQAQQAQLEALESTSAGLEGILSRLHMDSKNKEGDIGHNDAPEESIPDFSYLLLENRYRGNEEEIRKRLEIYPPVFKGTKKKILEIGPGRGELQVLLNEHGIPTYGVDVDEAMVKDAKARGLEVFLEDAVLHLRNLSDNFIGGVVAIQVIEHLSMSALKELFDLCYRKIAKGGCAVFETIDPRSLLALSSNYFRDPTHVFPLHPDTLSFALSTAGFKILEVRQLSPVPKEALLKELAVEEYMTPRWAFAIERLNSNIRQLNALLYGFQDYCVIAERP